MLAPEDDTVTAAVRVTVRAAVLDRVATDVGVSAPEEVGSAEEGGEGVAEIDTPFVGRRWRHTVRQAQRNARPTRDMFLSENCHQTRACAAAAREGCVCTYVSGFTLIMATGEACEVASLRCDNGLPFG